MYNIEQTLHHAIWHVRCIYNSKSNNKNYSQNEQDRAELSPFKQYFYSKEMVGKRDSILKKLRGNLKNLYGPQSLTSKNTFSYDRYARYYSSLPENLENPLAGNCGELSLSAYCYLVDNYHKLLAVLDGPDIMWIGVDFNKSPSHSFVLIGHRAQGEKSYDLRVREWKSAWICDPWANIACPAQRYPNEWRLKLTKWSSEGKRIYSLATSWVDPISNPLWLSMIRRDKNYGRYVVLRSYPD